MPEEKTYLTLFGLLVEGWYTYKLFILLLSITSLSWSSVFLLGFTKHFGGIGKNAFRNYTKIKIPKTLYIYNCVYEIKLQQI